jgi:broad specificity phosphatase PhoE
MQCYLVRHGQSEGNIDQPAPDDPRLTALGERQAASIIKTLRETEATTLYASAMTRALQTAQPTSRALGLPVHVWPDIVETSRRHWNEPVTTEPKLGLTVAEAQQGFDNVRSIDDSPQDVNWWKAIARERRADAYRRAKQVLRHLGEQHGEEASVILIGHAAFGSVLLSSALRTPPSDFNRYCFYNCSVTRLDCVDGEWALRYLNASGHLPADCRTPSHDRLGFQ